MLCCGVLWYVQVKEEEGEGEEEEEEEVKETECCAVVYFGMFK